MADFQPGFAGADINEFGQRRGDWLRLKNDTFGYWPIHHTHADTVDKVDPVQLKRNSGCHGLAGLDFVDPE